jgi:hypothetical protein
MDKLAALIEQNRLGLSVSDFELRVTERRIIIKAPYLQLCLLHKLLRDSDTTAVVKSSPETSFVTAVIEYAPVNSAEHTDFIALNTKLKDPTLNNVLSQLQFTEMPTVEIKEALDAIYIRCARNSRLCMYTIRTHCFFRGRQKKHNVRDDSTKYMCFFFWGGGRYFVGQLQRGATAS